MASLPRFESLQYADRVKERAERPGQVPTRMGVFTFHGTKAFGEDEADGGLGATQDECYQRDTCVVGEIPTMKVVWANRGGRSCIGAILKNFRRCVARAAELKHDSVEHRFHSDPSSGEQMLSNGWRSETIGRIGKEAK